MIKCYYDCCGKEVSILETRPVFRANATILDLDKFLRQCPECAQRQKMKEMGCDTMSIEEYELWLKKFNAKLKHAKEDIVQTGWPHPTSVPQRK